METNITMKPITTVRDFTLISTAPMLTNVKTLWKTSVQITAWNPPWKKVSIYTKNHEADLAISSPKFIYTKSNLYDMKLRCCCNIIVKPWWCHQMQTISALLAICAGNSPGTPVPGEFPAQRPVTQSFDVFFDLRLNKRLSKQSWDWWFETLSCPLWRHRNDHRHHQHIFDFISYLVRFARTKSKWYQPERKHA